MGGLLSAKDEVRILVVLLNPVLLMESQVASVVHSALFHLRQIAQLDFLDYIP